MNVSRLTALIRKEILEGVRAGWVNIPATAALTVMLLVASMATSRRTLSPDALAMLQARLPIFLPLLAMPFYASTVLNRAIQTERLRGGLLPLLVYGGSTAEVWLAKVLGAFLLAYVVMLLSLGGYVGYGVWLGRDFLPSASALPQVLIAMPLAALSLIALQALLFWVMGKSALLSVIVPLVIMFGGTQLVVLLGLRPISGAVGALAPLASCAVVTALAMIVARYPRERAAGF
ncbi:MAG TPA: ABC transporter permease [Thermoanaerobaculia bacterium]